MADTRITGLTADASPTSDDLVVTVNDPAGTAANRKVTIDDLLGTSVSQLITSALDLNGNLNISGNIVGDGTGLVLTGGNATGEDLTLRPNTNYGQEEGEIILDGRVFFHGSTTTFSSDADAIFPLIAAGGNWTINTNSGGSFGLGPGMVAFQLLNTVTWDVDPNPFGMATVFAHQTTHTNPAADSRTWQQALVFIDYGTWAVNTQTGATHPLWRSFHSQPVLSRSNSGTGTMTALYSFSSGVNVGTGMTVTDRQAFRVEARLGAGTVTKDVGLAVADLVATNTTSILLGTLTTPTGNYAIYDTTGDPSVFSGPVKMASKTDANRGTAAAAGAGAVIYNTDDANLNISNGTDWILPDGTVSP